MTKLDPFVHVKSHNPRNRLLQTEGVGKSYNFLGRVGTVGGGCREGGKSCKSQHQLLEHPSTDPVWDKVLSPCTGQSLDAPGFRFKAEIQERALLSWKHKLGTHHFELGYTNSPPKQLLRAQPSPKPSDHQGSTSSDP